MILSQPMQSLAGVEEAFLRWQFRLSIARQIDFLDSMVRLLSDGLPLHVVLGHIHDVGEPLDRAVAGVLLRKLDEGSPVDEAMESMFRFDLAAAIGAARESGDLSETGLPVLERLRDQQAARRGVIAQLGRPLLYIAVAATLYALFSAHVWPKFTEADQDFALHPLAEVLDQVGTFIGSYWHVAAGTMLVLLVVVRYLLRNWTGITRRGLDRLFPMTLYRGVHAANTLESIGTLLAAGHEPRTAIGALETHATPWLRMYLDRMRRRLDEGADLSGMLDVGLLMRRDMARLHLLADFRDLRTTIALTGLAARNLVLAQVRRVTRMLESLGIAVVALSLVAQIGAIYLTALEIQQEVVKVQDEQR
ncbi:MAG: hypothetical protein F4X98_03270 [Gammaproteobacteria bacterium]|nr:hypothetical protein [Gammaproteobacteria bacterium]